MATTYTLIAGSIIGSGGAASIDFTSIPSTYTDLLIKISARTNLGGANGWISGALTFNGSTSGYSGILLAGRGDLSPVSITSSSSNIEFAFYASNADTTANTFASNEIYIPNYLSANYKSLSTDIGEENNGARALAGLCAGLWSNTAAINQITLTPNSGSFAQYSSAYLYGIKNS